MAPAPAIYPYFSQASCLLPQAPMLNAVNPQAAQQGHKYNRDTSLDDIFTSFRGLPKASLEVMTKLYVDHFCFIQLSHSLCLH